MSMYRISPRVATTDTPSPITRIRFSPEIWDAIFKRLHALLVGSEDL
jgi:hypothetical protein